MAMVKGPVRPTNMSALIRSFPATLRVGETFIERPTVPKADTASKSNASKRPVSVMRSKVKTSSTMMNEMETMATALYITLLGMERPNNSTSSPPNTLERTASTSTLTVVTLTPPAVPPGAAPMNISAMINRTAAPPSSDMSTVLKPAVRAVTEQKNEAKSFSFSGRLSRVWSNSRK
jgi:hypothetical protein